MNKGTLKRLLVGSSLSSGTKPVNVVKPMIVGNFIEGQTVTIIPGKWLRSPTQFLYKLYRDEVPVSGVINLTRVLTSSDVAHALTVEELATNEAGTRSAFSAPTAVITAATPSPPVNQTPPIISGSTVRGGTMTVTPGSYSPTPDRIDHQWRADGVNIEGETGLTFTSGDAHVGKSITCREVAVNSKGGGTPAISNALGPITVPLGSAVITSQGVVASFNDVASVGQYVDGSWWLVPSDPNVGVLLTSVSIAPTETVDLYLGGMMLDPGRPGFANIKKHAFDPRKTATGGGPGQAAIYDPTYAVPVPARVKPWAEGPITIWLYRGLDKVSTGGGATGCAYMVQITVCPSAPASNAIKPPGLYCAGGKPQVTQSDINYGAFPSLPVPTGAVAPNWDSDFGMHKYPWVRFGDRNNSASYVPGRTIDQYPADQLVMTNMVAVGCCANIPKRNELIDRMVRDGLDIHAGTAFAADNSAFAAGGGGFGFGGRLPRFMAAVALGRADMHVTPPESLSNEIGVYSAPFFGESGCTLWSVKKTGDVADPVNGTYEPLYGTFADNWTDRNYPNKHCDRDNQGLRDSYRLPNQTWVVESVGTDWFTVTAASHDASHYKPNNLDNQGYHYGLRIMTGTNAGKWLFMAQKVTSPTTGKLVDISWDNSLRKVTVETLRTDYATPVVMPNVGDVVEYRNASSGIYQSICSAPLLGTCMAVVLTGKIADYVHNDDERASFMYSKKWQAIGGAYPDRKQSAPPLGRSSNVFSRTYGPYEATLTDAAGKKVSWLRSWWATALASWPTWTGPLS